MTAERGCPAQGRGGERRQCHGTARCHSANSCQYSPMCLLNPRNIQERHRAVVCIDRTSFCLGFQSPGLSGRPPSAHQSPADICVLTGPQSGPGRHTPLLLGHQHQKCSAVPKTRSLVTETQFGAPAPSEAKSLCPLEGSLFSGDSGNGS